MKSNLQHAAANRHGRFYGRFGSLQSSRRISYDIILYTRTCTRAHNTSLVHRGIIGITLIAIIIIIPIRLYSPRSAVIDDTDTTPKYTHACVSYPIFLRSVCDYCYYSLLLFIITLCSSRFRLHVHVMSVLGTILYGHTMRVNYRLLTLSSLSHKHRRQVLYLVVSIYSYTDTEDKCQMVIHIYDIGTY